MREQVSAIVLRLQSWAYLGLRLTAHIQLLHPQAESASADLRSAPEQNSWDALGRVLAANKRINPLAAR